VEALDALLALQAHLHTGSLYEKKLLVADELLRRLSSKGRALPTRSALATLLSMSLIRQVSVSKIVVAVDVELSVEGNARAHKARNEVSATIAAIIAATVAATIATMKIIKLQWDPEGDFILHSLLPTMLPDICRWQTGGDCQ
jgi:hypothetical protein